MVCWQDVYLHVPIHQQFLCIVVQMSEGRHSALAIQSNTICSFGSTQYIWPSQCQFHWWWILALSYLDNILPYARCCLEIHWHLLIWQDLLVWELSLRNSISWMYTGVFFICRKIGRSSHLIIVFIGIKKVFKSITVQWLDFSKKRFILFYKNEDLQAQRPWRPIQWDHQWRPGQKARVPVDQICMAAGWYGHNTFIKIELPWKMIGKINLASKRLRTTAALVFSDFFFSLCQICIKTR